MRNGFFTAFSTFFSFGPVDFACFCGGKASTFVKRLITTRTKIAFPFSGLENSVSTEEQAGRLHYTRKEFKDEDAHSRFNSLGDDASAFTRTVSHDHQSTD
jgi:hypothetical protein